MMPSDKMKFLKCGEIWWYESNRKLPINIFLKGDFKYFRSTLVSLNSKDVKIAEVIRAIPLQPLGGGNQLNPDIGIKNSS